MIVDVARGVSLADEFDTGSPGEISMVGDPALARVEHLLHESIHAISLRMTPGRGMVEEVGLLLAGFADKGTWEEAKTLACTTMLFARFGHPLNMDDVRDTAYVQGARDVLDDAFVSPETADLLDRVVAWAVEAKLFLV